MSSTWTSFEDNATQIARVPQLPANAAPFTPPHTAANAASAFENVAVGSTTPRETEDVNGTVGAGRQGHRRVVSNDSPVPRTLSVTPTASMAVGQVDGLKDKVEGEVGKIPAPPVVTGSRKWKSSNNNNNKPFPQSTSGHQPASLNNHWRINDEQCRYYRYQFEQIQPDITSVVAGHQARTFFTKSDIPVRELSQIWELSDIDRDGYLSLPEFCYAFHLVVLRKKYQTRLPPVLPEEMMQSAQPLLMQIRHAHAVRAHHSQQVQKSNSASTVAPNADTGMLTQAFNVYPGQAVNGQPARRTSSTTENLISLEAEQQPAAQSAFQAATASLHPNPSPYYLNNHLHFNDPGMLPKSEYMPASGGGTFDQDANWETFSEISTISSISLAKFPPSGTYTVPPYLNGNGAPITKPTAIRLTPSKISAAGGSYNPWQQDIEMYRLQELEKEKQANSVAAAVQSSSQESLPTRQPGQKGLASSDELAGHSNERLEPQAVSPPTASAASPHPGKSVQDISSNSVYLNSSIKHQNLLNQSQASSDIRSQQKGVRKRHNSSSSSVPMMIAGDQSHNIPDIHEQKREHYQRIAEGEGEDSSMSSGSESENPILRQESQEPLRPNSSHAQHVPAQVKQKSSSLPKNSRLPEDPASNGTTASVSRSSTNIVIPAEEESESTKEHDPIDINGDESANLVGGRGASQNHWVQDGLIDRANQISRASCRHTNSSRSSSSESSSSTSSDESEPEPPPTDIGMPTSTRTRSEQSIVANSAAMSALKGSCSRDLSEDDIASEISQRLRNSSMNNLVPIDSPKTPHRGAQGVSHSTSADTLPRHKSSDSNEAGFHQPKIVDVPADPGVKLLHKHNTAKKKTESSAITSPGNQIHHSSSAQYTSNGIVHPGGVAVSATMSAIPRQPVSSAASHKNMVSNIRERNLRLQRMNAELHSELRSLKEDRIQLEVHIAKFKAPESNL